MKKLFLVEKKDLYPHIAGIEITEIYKATNVVQRLIRYIHIKSCVFKWLLHYWYGDWKYDISKYDVIVILDSLLDNDIIPFIRRHNSCARLNLCYRNRVATTMGHSVFLRDPRYWKEKFNCSTWSYSKEDCNSYDMSFYSQFFMAKDIPNYTHNTKYDVFFVGKDKGRLNQLLSIKDFFQQNGYVSLFIIIPDRRRYTKLEKRELSKPIPYKEVIHYDIHSLCILDIVTDDNYGLTYRVLEAIFLNKKLITNYSDIVSYEFYHPNNVFIIGKDNWKNFGSFIRSNNVLIPDTVKSKYSFENFINSIFK